MNHVTRKITKAVVAIDYKKSNMENEKGNSNFYSILVPMTTQCEQQQQQYNPKINIVGNSCFDEEEESRSFQQTLRHHKSVFKEYQNRWSWQKNNQKANIPTTSWPLNVPEKSELSSLEVDLEFCRRSSNKVDTNTVNNENEKHYCTNLQFRIASYLLLQTDNIDAQQRGLKVIKELVEEQKDPDAMCAYATCLNDGRVGQEPNPTVAMSWWKIASDYHHHIQSMYELGVGYYTGVEGVEEDEEKAVKYFRKAAECGHVGAAYMLGDCLLDGVGVNRDRSEALEWLVTAAELGHRGARSRVLAVLGKKDGESYGEFTDASRQTLKQIDVDGEERKEDTISQISLEQQQDVGSSVLLERRYTIGAKNPIILARKKTAVRESRE